MSNIGTKNLAPFVFYTRFGIGVFDEDWLEFRIRAFSALTLPSVTSIMRPQDKWIIFIDRDMPQSSYHNFKKQIEENPAKSNIVLEFVDYSFEVSERLEAQLHQSFDYGYLYLTRIDDDDALRFDTIHKFIDLAIRTDSNEIFMSSTSAIECFPVERFMLQSPLKYLVNVAYGTPASLSGFASVGHTGLIDWAKASGKITAELPLSDAIFLYNRHRQSSSRFTSRRSYAREHPEMRIWTTSDFRAFNLDIDKLLDFRRFAGTAPYSKDGSLWEDSEKYTKEAFEAWKILKNKKMELKRSRTSLLKSIE